MHVEPYTSAIDNLESNSEDSFKIKKGEKIAEIVSPNNFEIVLEMEQDGKIIANWCERMAFAVEGDKVLNLHAHIYKISGYKHDVIDECMYEKMISHIRFSRSNVDEIIEKMKAANVVAIRE